MSFTKTVAKFGFTDEEMTLIAPGWDTSGKSFAGGKEVFFLNDKFIRKYSGFSDVKTEFLEEILKAKTTLETDAATVRFHVFSEKTQISVNLIYYRRIVPSRKNLPLF